MTVTVAGGQGMYGDSVDDVATLLAEGIDYLCLEALAELTLAILGKDKRRDERLGYTRDLPRYLDLVLPAVGTEGVRVITNAGGLNTPAAGRAAVETARRLGLTGLRIATIMGDDVAARLTELSKPTGLAHLEDGRPWHDHAGDLTFANVYLGAEPIVRALEMGADVVITGRVADASLFLAPLMYEFGWKADDHDLLAAGTVIGHLSECAGQSTGGNFSGEWWTVPEPWKWAYPIMDCEPDGAAVLRKADGVGGRIDFDTVRHQLLYEVHDPAAYVTPDVTADFTTVRLEEISPDRVRISGATGRPATNAYKLLVASVCGWASEARVAFGWPDAYAKAQMFAQLIRHRVAMAGLEVDDWHEEYWGVNALHGDTVPREGANEAPEVILRVAWACQEERMAAAVARQLPPIGLSAPPWGASGALRGIQPPSAQFELWPSLVDKGLVDPGVTIHVEDV